MNSPWNNSWNTAWGASPPAGTLPPAAPNVPSWIGGGGGYSLGGGPYGSQATTPNNAPTTATGRVNARELADMFSGYGAKALGGTALGTGAALAAGFSPSFGDVMGNLAGNLASPGNITGLAGNVAAKAAGFTNPTGAVGRVASAINPVVAMGLGLMSPLAGLGYSFAAPFVADALGDATDSRRDEKHRDALESAHGTFGGRAAARDFDAMATVGGFGSLGKMAQDYGYGPTDLARGMSNRDASKAMAGRNPSGSSYGGWGSMGGPVGGARSMDSAYGRSMGGFAGLGIGNPSSYGGGGGGSGGRDSGGFGSNDGNSDTAGNAGFGR
ncbi:hypothetical protein NLA06_12620 [Desulfomicrobium sp. ZS1]|uniref:hypothetical protein n=1 Tax=Desulfomicrobium sp. ZS1 TaxID=2952228 RepID=UPI0020B3C91F|nr:hypothetical protein [Desulfomicrobium sp. ZS1]UTF49400.1 hypothetical protein NLA06_12620 [Desulfomicrobium sp. ZS1]